MIHLNHSVKKFFGALAQMGERLDGIQEVAGSIPACSTYMKLFYLSIFSKENISSLFLVALNFLHSSSFLRTPDISEIATK